MASNKEPIGEMILKRVFSCSDDIKSKNPTVLSCGGIYIPHRKRREQILYHILNTPSESEPVKVVAGARPRNVLFEVLMKESMN
jgi:hypothetical protein